VVIDALAGLDPGQQRALFVDAIGRDDQEDRLADGLDRRVAEQTLGGGVPAGDRSVQLTADDRVVGRLHDRRQQRAHLLGVVARGDVGDDRDARRAPAERQGARRVLGQETMSRPCDGDGPVRSPRPSAARPASP